MAKANMMTSLKWNFSKKKIEFWLSYSLWLAIKLQTYIYFFIFHDKQDNELCKDSCCIVMQILKKEEIEIELIFFFELRVFYSILIFSSSMGLMKLELCMWNPHRLYKTTSMSKNLKKSFESFHDLQFWSEHWYSRTCHSMRLNFTDGFNLIIKTMKNDPHSV